MDFRELSYVLAIAEHGGITRAAQTLYISQPTLSKFLAGLEEDLGVKLFRRMGHKYLLTYAGERYVDKARQILRLKNDLDSELADIVKRDVGVLNVAFPPLRCGQLLPGTLPPFAERYPHVQVNVFEGSSDENDKRLLAGQVDLVFYIAPNAPDPQILYHRLWEEELFICTCHGHPLGRLARPDPDGGAPRLDPALLKGERVLMMLPPQRTRQIVDEQLRARGIRLEKVLYTGNLAAIMELVAAGYGVSFVFGSHLRRRTGTQPIDCYRFAGERVRWDFVAATRRGGYLPGYAQAFIEIAKGSGEEK